MDRSNIIVLAGRNFTRYCLEFGVSLVICNCRYLRLKWSTSRKAPSFSSFYKGDPLKKMKGFFQRIIFYNFLVFFKWFKHFKCRLLLVYNLGGTMLCRETHIFHIVHVNSSTSIRPFLFCSKQMFAIKLHKLFRSLRFCWFTLRLNREIYVV